MFGGWTMSAYFFRSEPGAAELRRLARGESGRVRQRVLMIANMLEGMEHEEAARLAEVIVEGPPSLAGLATHILDRQQHLLAVLTHPEHDQQHDRGGLAVEPHPHHRTVADQAHDRFLGERAGIPGIPIGFHLSPHPAHGIPRLREGRLLLTAPPNTAASARRTRR